MAPPVVKDDHANIRRNSIVAHIALWHASVLKVRWEPPKNDIPAPIVAKVRRNDGDEWLGDISDNLNTKPMYALTFLKNSCVQ